MPDFVKSRTVEKIDVSSANNLVTETRFSGRSLMYIKKRRGPRTEPCGTPALTLSQLDD